MPARPQRGRGDVGGDCSGPLNLSATTAGRARALARGGDGTASWGAAAAGVGLALGILGIISGIAMKDYLLAASGVATIVSGYFLRAAFFWGAELLRSAGRQESVLDQQLAMMDEDEEE